MLCVTDVSDLRAPDYTGGSLNNLVAELERRLTGSSPAPGLHPRLAGQIPEAATYILLLIDGLGAHQLDHPAAAPLAADLRGVIDAPFPTTTSVSLASVATGLPPRRHGLIGHFVLLPGFPTPVNSLRWIDAAGRPADFDTSGLLPAPNLWERLGRAGVEPITIQPVGYTDTPLTRALYRGCRFEGVTLVDQLVMAAAGLARTPDRLVFVYFPAVDAAAHMHGTAGPEYRGALSQAAAVWERIAVRLPPGAAMVGTADHGFVSVAESGKHRLTRRAAPELTLYGDPRSLYVRGPAERIEGLGTDLPAVWHPAKSLETLWGPEEGDPFPLSPPAALKKPDGAFLAREGCALLPGHMDRRMIGYHGGLDPREVEIPLLTAAP